MERRLSSPAAPVGSGFDHSLLLTFCFVIIIHFALFWFFHFKFWFRHAIVSDLAAFGAAVHTCSRTQTELNKCLQEWQSLGFPVTGSVCDVSSPSQREKLIEEVTSILNGKLNIYVSTTHNAKAIHFIWLYLQIYVLVVLDLKFIF